MKLIKIKWLYLISIIIAVLTLTSFLVYSKASEENEEITEKIECKPALLKEGQCIIRVLGHRGALFEKMKRECRLLVILDKDGRLIEIIEK